MERQYSNTVTADMIIATSRRVKKMATSIELVVFDLAGTTVDDSIAGLPLVTVAMKEAFKNHDIRITAEQVNPFRGMEKKEAIKNLLHESNHECILINDTRGTDENQAAVVETIFKDFKAALDSHLVDIDKEIHGTTESFQFLQSKGIQIAVGSGFPHNVVVSLVEKLGWKDIVDFSSSAENEGYGRPHPSLIHSAMKHCGVTDKRKVVKIGDTVIDVEEGKNAGCKTVAVLTGTQSEPRLKQSNPDYIIKSVAELPEVIKHLETMA